MARAQLLSVPTEILVNIASSLTTADYGKLRLTCKTVEQRIFPFFATEFFSTRQVMISQLSLDVLVEISRHQALKSYVKKIILGYDYVYLFPPSTSRDQGGPRNAGAVYQKWEAQSWLFSSGEAKDLLTLALRNLEHCQCVELRDFVSKRLRPRDLTRWRSYGAKTMEQSIPPDTLRMVSHPQAPLPNPFLIILRALAQSQSHLEALQVITRESCNSIPSSAFFIPDYLYAEYSTAFKNVRTLMLCVFTLHNTPGFEIMQYSKDFCSFLTLMPNLAHLRLNFNGLEAEFSAPLILSNAKHALQTARLRRLELGRAILDEGTLLEFIISFTDTLEHLTLRRINLSGGKSDNNWAPFARGLKKLKSLTSIDLQEVGHYIESRAVCWPLHIKPTSEDSDSMGQIAVDNNGVYYEGREMESFLTKLEEACTTPIHRKSDRLDSEDELSGSSDVESENGMTD